MAHPERFELPTKWFEATYSIQLSYGCGNWLPNCRFATANAFYLPERQIRAGRFRRPASRDTCTSCTSSWRSPFG
jgi:hypothetical protein